MLAAFAATVWFFGPRAWRIASAHLRGDGGGGVLVPLDRVDSFRGPEWLEGPLLQVVLEDLEPRMRGEVRLMDDAAARQARARIAESPFVRSVRLERRFPDRFRIELDVRRPEVQLVSDARVVALLGAAGDTLPPGTADLDLPRVPVDDYIPPVPIQVARFGQPFPDPRVVAAAAVAREWREIVAPALGPDAPPLRTVDARNVGWKWVADVGTSQILIGLGTADGRTAWFHYGVAEADAGPATASTRAEVLRRILTEYPGLRGVRSGDLRLHNTWRDSLRFE